MIWKATPILPRKTASKCKKNAFKLISDPCIWSRAHNLPSDAFERSASSIFAANISFWQILWKSQCCVSKQGRDKMVRFVKTTCKLWFREPVPEKNTFCGFWPNRTLPYFPLSSVLRPPSVTGVTYQLFSLFWRFIPWKPYIFWMHII